MQTELTKMAWRLGVDSIELDDSEGNLIRINVGGHSVWTSYDKNRSKWCLDNDLELQAQLGGPKIADRYFDHLYEAVKHVTKIYDQIHGERYSEKVA